MKAFLKDTAALAIIALSGALLIQSMSSTSIASEAPQAAASDFVVGTVSETRALRNAGSRRRRPPSQPETR